MDSAGTVADPPPDRATDVAWVSAYMASGGGPVGELAQISAAEPVAVFAATVLEPPNMSETPLTPEARDAGSSHAPGELFAVERLASVVIGCEPLSGAP